MSTLNTEQKPLSCAIKHDTFKPPLGLIPKSALDEEAAVLGFGAEKYETNNWRKGMPWSRLISAAMRHLVDFNAGQDFDKESGLHSLAHVRACCAFLIEYTTTHPELDDRFKKLDSAKQAEQDAINTRLRTMLDSVANGPKTGTSTPVPNERTAKDYSRELDKIQNLDGQSKSPPWLSVK